MRIPRQLRYITDGYNWEIYHRYARDYYVRIKYVPSHIRYRLVIPVMSDKQDIEFCCNNRYYRYALCLANYAPDTVYLSQPALKNYAALTWQSMQRNYSEVYTTFENIHIHVRILPQHLRKHIAAYPGPIPALVSLNRALLAHPPN